MCSRCRRDDIHVCFAYASPQRMPHIYDHQWTTRASGRKCLRFSGLSWVVTVTFQNIAACKLLFFVKNKGQWNAKSGPKVGDGEVAM